MIQARCDKKMYNGLRELYHLFMSDFNEICTFWTDFGKILKYQISRKSFHADGWSHGAKIIGAFWNFVNASNKVLSELK
jgi:hypothetical protein